MKTIPSVEEIALDLMCTEKLMPRKEDVVSDNLILRKIKKLKNLEETDRDGRTLLINASTYGRECIVKYLISHKANINTKDSIGFTALHAAVIKNHIEIIEILLKNGADCNGKDECGNTPINKTNPTTPISVFKLLLSYGADPYIKNNFGISAIDSFSAYPAILEILKN